MSPIDAWHDIRGDRREQEDNTKALERGTQLESTILDWCGKRLELPCTKPPFVVHPDHKFLGDSADAIYSEKDRCYVGEAKSVALGSADRWGEEGTDQVPDHVLIQAHMHLMHWPEAQRCVIPVLIGGYDFEFRIYWIDRSASLEAKLIDRLSDWHRDHIAHANMPEPTAQDEGWLKQAYPKNTRDAITDESTLEEIARWAHDYDRSRAECKALETSKQLAANRLRALMSDAGSARFDSVSVTYRNSKDRTALDTVGIARCMGWDDAVVTRRNREDIDLSAVLTRAGVPDTVLHQFTRIVPGPRSLRVTIQQSKE
jgi:hypothetical protein